MGAVSAGVDQLDTTLTAVDFLEREKELIQKAAAAFPVPCNCDLCTRSH